MRSNSLLYLSLFLLIRNFFFFSFLKYQGFLKQMKKIEILSKETEVIF